jgi:hypothetical protein
MPQPNLAEENSAPGSNRAERRRSKDAGLLRPRLISIDAGYRYAGCGRSKFYDDLRPHLESVRIGRRRLIVLESLDRLIDELRSGERTA